MDADAGANRRRIVAFVGGLDLCDGRYDTPQHPLFRTLLTVHKDDFHNPTFTVQFSNILVRFRILRSFLESNLVSSYLEH